MGLIKLFSFILMSVVISMTATAGNVISHSIPDQGELHLRKNHRFVEKKKNPFPGTNFKSKGTWTLTNDTLYLQYDLIQCKDRKWYKDCECTYSEAMLPAPAFKYVIVNGTLTAIGEKRFGIVVHASAFKKFIRRCRRGIMGI